MKINDDIKLDKEIETLRGDWAKVQVIKRKDLTRTIRFFGKLLIASISFIGGFEKILEVLVF